MLKDTIINIYAAGAVYKQKGKLENKMQSTFRQHFNTIAKQAVQMHGSWLCGLNSLSSDRTPEGYISSGSKEGDGYA